MSIDITTLALAKEYTNRMVGSGGTGGGVNGKDGITPHIGDNGNWFIGTVDTGISAQGPAGENGVTPHIGTNGNWYIGSVNTGVSAKGVKGDNGLDGNGIKSAILNSDYTLTLTFDDGTTYTTPSIRGAAGAPGSVGKDGTDGVGIASIKQTTTSTADGGNNVFTVTLTNGTSATFTVKNGSKGSTGKDGSNGVDGGHYAPVVTQPTTDTMQISFAPSKSDMPAVNPVTVNLPVSENSGQNVDLTSVQTILRNVMMIIRAQVEDMAGTPQAYNIDISGLAAECDALIAGLTGPGDENPDVPEQPTKTLTGISAVYSGGSVPVGTAVSALTGVVVTAHYSDGSTAVVSGYILSGTIAEGSNTITVTYGGMTATITVVGEKSGSTPTLETYAFSMDNPGMIAGDYGVFETNGAYNSTGRVALDDGADTLTVYTDPVGQHGPYIAFYGADGAFLDRQTKQGALQAYDIPAGATEFILTVQATVVTTVIYKGTVTADQIGGAV